MDFNLDPIGAESPQMGMETPPTAESLGILGTAGDIGMGVVRGLAGGVEGVYDLADFLAFDILPDAEDNFGLGHSETLAGGLVEGISQFMVGFIPGMAVASKLGKVTNLASKVNKAAQTAKAAGAMSKARAISWGAEFGKAAVAGGIADFTVFDAQEERLSNLLQAYPSLQNPVSAFLAADENDWEVEGRLKNLLEGGILGTLTEPFVLGLKALRNARKARLDGADPDEAIDSVIRRRQEGEVQRPLDPQSPEFRNWFEESKIINETGEPMVVYHGSRNGFEEFDTGPFGTHVGTSKAANDRLQKANDTLWDENGDPLPSNPQVYPLYARINNPLRMDDVGEWHNAVDVARELRKNPNLRNKYEDLDEILDEAEQLADQYQYAEFDAPPRTVGASPWTESPENAALLQELRDIVEFAGYDGIVYTNKVEDVGVDSYIVFNSNQLKSVNNRGSFSTTDSNLLRRPVEEGGDRPINIITMFSGAGTLEAAFSRSVRSLMAVEYDQAIVDQFNNVHGTNYTARSVFDVDPQEIKAAVDAGADLFHASPVCKNFSTAKRGATPNADDLKSAQKVAEAITVARPPLVTIENVPAYRNTALFDEITGALDAQGYSWRVDVIDAADYGGVSRRKRMILRAVRDGDVPPLPPKSAPGDWYQALKGMIDEAPDAPKARGSTNDSGIPDWEYNRIQGMIERGELDGSKPIITMGGSTDRVRAYAANAGGPAPTLKATKGEVVRILLPDGRVKRATPEMLAKLMGMPEGMNLPRDPQQAKLVLGNGIDGNVTRNIIEPLAAGARGEPDEFAGSLFRLTEDEAVPSKPRGETSYPPDPKSAGRTDKSIARGIDAVKNRINREMGEGRLSRENGERAINIINRLNRSGWLNTLGLRFRNLFDAGGLYSVADDVITMATRLNNDPAFAKTFAHELFHSLTRRLGVTDMRAMNKDFLKSRAKFMKKHGLTEKHFATIDGVTGLTPDGIAMLRKQGLTLDDWYKYSNIDEWIAESMADATLRRMDLEENTKTLLGFAKFMAHEVMTIVKSQFGGARYDRIARDMFKGRYADAPLGVKRFTRTTGSAAKGGLIDDSEVGAYRRSKALRPQNEPGATEYVRNMETPAEQVRRVGGGVLRRPFEDGPFPDGARTPADGAAINLDRFSDIEGVDKMLVEMTNTSSESFQRELMDVKNLGVEEANALGNQAARDLQAAGFDAFNPDDLRGLGVTDQVETIIAQQNVARRLLQQFTQMTDDLARQAMTGSDRDKVLFALARKRSQDLAIVVKRNQERIAQALNAQKAVGTDVTPLPQNRLVPPDVSDIDEPKFFNDVLEDMGGGDAAAGREAIDRQIREYQTAVEANGAGAGFKHLQERAKFTNMLTEYWMNSILSGPVTHAVNITSNTITTFWLPFEKTFGYAMTGQFAEASSTLKHYTYLFQNFSDALKMASATFRHENDLLDNVGKMDTDRTTRAISARGAGIDPDSVAGKAMDWMGTVLNLPSRFLMAEDAFFKQINYRASVKSQLMERALKDRDLVAKGPQALAQSVEAEFAKIIDDGQFYSYKNMRAKAEAAAMDKIGGDLTDPSNRRRFSRYVNAYMKRNWDEENGALANIAREVARDVTYTRALTTADRHPLVRMSGSMQKLVNQHPILRFFLPFIRTPTNLTAFYLDRAVQAPYELAKIGLGNTGRRLGLLSKEVAEGMSRGGRTREELVGRTATGALLFGTAAMAFSNGILSGGGPRDPETRRTWEATGWQPYSIRMGDKWVSYRRFDPFASFLGSVADLMESMKEARTETENSAIESISASIVFAAARNVTNKTYLTGISRIANLLNDPERFSESYIQQTAASFVPFSGAAGQTVGQDEYQREIRSVLDAVRAKYGMTGNVLGGKVDPRRNVLGEELKKSQPWPWYGSPFAYSEVEDDEIMQEVAALGHGFGPPRVIRNGLNLAEYRNNQGQSFHDRWSELHGSVRVQGKDLKTALRTLIRSPKYQSMAADPIDELESPRVAEVRKVINKYRAAALDRALQEFPEVQQADNRMTMLKTFRREGRDISSILEF